jgi:hypothetical protein
MLSHRQAGRLYASLLALSNKALRIQGRCTNTAKLKPDETSTGYVSAGMAVLWSSLSACTAAKTAAHGQTMRAQHSQAVASHRGVTQYNSCTPAGAPTALRPIGGCGSPPPHTQIPGLKQSMCCRQHRKQQTTSNTQLHAQICFEASKARGLEDTRAVILLFIKLPCLNTLYSWHTCTGACMHCWHHTAVRKQEATRL